MADGPKLQENFMVSVPLHHESVSPVLDEETRLVETIVVALIPEFDQVKVQDGEGRVYALTRKTPGVDLRTLAEGQRVLCTVTLKLPRVLNAEAVA